MSDLHDQIELVDPETLIPYSNNPKEHPEDQVRAIASSIKNYGWDQPIVVDGEDEIIKGHGRMQAAELLGLEKVPVIRRNDLTDAEAKAARIADNKTAESAWDDELLAAELDILDETDLNIADMGFDEDELSEYLDMVDPPEPDFAGVPDEPPGEDDMNVVIIAESEPQAEEIGAWADDQGYEWHVVDN